ncbi:hypothetical protein [Nocardioides sp. YIM 152588]|uniref:hypothetical protein n=1 Tax=Nocardioides sp. YIM 152588 TaxID=3158259 RepID=UPI0032E503C2
MLYRDPSLARVGLIDHRPPNDRLPAAIAAKVDEYEETRRRLADAEKTLRGFAGYYWTERSEAAAKEDARAAQEAARTGHGDLAATPHHDALVRERQQAQATVDALKPLVMAIGFEVLDLAAEANDGTPDAEAEAARKKLAKAADALQAALSEAIAAQAVADWIAQRAAYDRSIDRTVQLDLAAFPATHRYGLSASDRVTVTLPELIATLVSAADPARALAH